MSESEEKARLAEVFKYQTVYAKSSGYRMGEGRKAKAQQVLSEFSSFSSYLDVGCGRGEMLNYVRHELGFNDVLGTETVDSLLIPNMVVKATVDSLPFPDAAFEVVSMFDVIEHLNLFDLTIACKELDRVAENVVIITASNLPSVERGMDLHITKKPYIEWDTFFRGVFSNSKLVTWRKDLSCRVNETWVIQK